MVDPVSLTIALTGAAIAVGASLVALCRKQKNALVENNHNASSDGIIIELGGYTETTTDNTNHTTTVTVKERSKITIQATDNSVGKNDRINAINGYDSNSVANMRTPSIPGAPQQGNQPAPETQQQPLLPQNKPPLTGGPTGNPNTYSAFSIDKLLFQHNGTTVTIEGVNSTDKSSPSHGNFIECKTPLHAAEPSDSEQAPLLGINGDIEAST